MLIFSILFSLFRIILNAAKMDEGAVLLAFSVLSFPYRFLAGFWYSPLNVRYLSISKTY